MAPVLPSSCGGDGGVPRARGFHGGGRRLPRCAASRCGLWTPGRLRFSAVLASAARAARSRRVGAARRAPRRLPPALAVHRRLRPAGLDLGSIGPGAPSTTSLWCSFRPSAAVPVARVGRVGACCKAAAEVHGGSRPRAPLLCPCRHGARQVQGFALRPAALVELALGCCLRPRVVSARCRWPLWLLVLTDRRLCRCALAPGENPTSTLSLLMAAAALDAVSSLEVPLWSSSTYYLASG